MARRRTYFASAIDHQSNRNGIAGPPSRKTVLAEAGFLVAGPKNRFERRSYKKRLKAFLKKGKP